MALARLTALLRAAESGATSISGLAVDTAWRELAIRVEALLARYRWPAEQDPEGSRAGTGRG